MDCHGELFKTMIGQEGPVPPEAVLFERATTVLFLLNHAHNIGHFLLDNMMAILINVMLFNDIPTNDFQASAPGTHTAHPHKYLCNLNAPLFILPWRPKISLADPDTILREGRSQTIPRPAPPRDIALPHHVPQWVWEGGKGLMQAPLPTRRDMFLNETFRVAEDGGPVPFQSEEEFLEAQSMPSQYICFPRLITGFGWCVCVCVCVTSSGQSPPVCLRCETLCAASFVFAICTPGTPSLAG